MNRRTFSKLLLVCTLLVSPSVSFYRTHDQIIFAVAGDRKIKIQEIKIQTANPVTWSAEWQLFIEDKVGGDRFVNGGTTTGSFGPVATFNTMTGLQMRNAVKTAVQADANVPVNDSVN